MPGAGLVLKDDLKMYSMSWEGWYFFAQVPGLQWYVGAGPGVHIYRSDVTEVRATLNVPLGFQKRLGKGAAWFGELKVLIADDEADSSLRFSLGVNFGGNP